MKKATKKKTTNTTLWATTGYANCLTFCLTLSPVCNGDTGSVKFLVILTCVVKGGLPGSKQLLSTEAYARRCLCSRFFSIHINMVKEKNMFPILWEEGPKITHNFLEVIQELVTEARRGILRPDLVLFPLLGISVSSFEYKYTGS